MLFIVNTNGKVEISNMAPLTTELSCTKRFRFPQTCYLSIGSSVSTTEVEYKWDNLDPVYTQDNSFPIASYNIEFMYTPNNDSETPSLPTLIFMIKDIETVQCYCNSGDSIVEKKDTRKRQINAV